MKKSLLIVCSLIFAISISSSAFAVTYDFNSMASGTYSEADFNSYFLGVSFNNTSENSFWVGDTTDDLQADFSGMAVLNLGFNNVGNSTIATFSAATDFVSVTMGDYNGDAENLYLNAYNNANVLIGSAFFANPESSYAGATLSVSSILADIAYVEFYGLDDRGLNTVFWDNFTFNENANTPVPEPSTIFLLTAGVGIFSGLRKKNKQ